MIIRIQRAKIFRSRYNLFRRYIHRTCFLVCDLPTALLSGLKTPCSLSTSAVSNLSLVKSPLTVHASANPFSTEYSSFISAVFPVLFSPLITLMFGENSTSRLAKIKQNHHRPLNLLMCRNPINQVLQQYLLQRWNDRH